MDGILECPREIPAIQGPFGEQVKQNLEYLLDYCRQHAGALQRELDVRTLLRELDTLASVHMGGGRGIVDLAFLEYLREQVQEVKKRRISRASTQGVKGVRRPV